MFSYFKYLLDFMDEIRRGHTHRNKNEAIKNKKERVAAAALCGSIVQEISTGRPQLRTEGLPLARHFTSVPIERYGDAAARNPDEEFKGSQPKRTLEEEQDIEQSKSACVESSDLHVPSAREARSSSRQPSTSSKQPRKSAFRGGNVAAAPPIMFFQGVENRVVDNEVSESDLVALIEDMSQSYDENVN
jgi:hypothetical protein